MARAIVRASINGPSPNNKQQELRKVLANAGFRKIGTAAYEGRFPTSTDAFAAVQDGMDYLDALPAGYEIDHLWVYLDRT